MTKMSDVARKYELFQIILDEPSKNPALAFGDYAEAFKGIIERSRPRFSIGIFGGWGSGKTTLMSAVERALEPNDTVIKVWFNAWRYEKEPHLIVPMLDTLREALNDWALRRSPAQGSLRARALKAASTVGRAALAIMAGMSVSAKFGGVVDAKYEASKALAEWRENRPDDMDLARQSQSVFHASFTSMRDSLMEFVGEDDYRIVIFIDDLDRCLPANALQVLESMKLFFDLEGFVFVAGLDQVVIERAIAEHYYQTAGAKSSDQVVSGADYVKKIFQVPFGVPPVRPQQLRAFVNTIVAEAELGSDQIDDINGTVWPHLKHLADEESVNPREIKRFINAYTLQLKMLEPRLRTSLLPNVILALQAMNFRADWRELYDQLAANPSEFRAALDTAIQDGYWPDRKRTPVPSSFVSYVQSDGNVLMEGNLDEYISSVEATHRTDAQILDISRAVRETWRALARVAETKDPKVARETLTKAMEPLMRQTPRSEGAFAETVARKTRDLSRQVERLESVGVDDGAWERWIERFGESLESLADDVDERRRLTSVGGTA